MSEEYFSIKRELVTLHIDKKPYTVMAVLSLADGEMLIAATEENYRQVVASFIRKHIRCDEEEKPSVEQIARQEDAVFAPLFEAILRQSESLRKYYEQRSNVGDICSRLVLAVRDEYEEFAKTVGQSIKTAFEKSKLLPTVQAIKLPDNWTNPLKQFADAIQSITAPINSLLKSIHIPTFSEEQKQKFAEAHKKWGEYGWTQPPTSEMNLFLEAPADHNSANEQVLAFCKDNDMQAVFSLLRKMKDVKKSDLEEAIFDFEHKKYKSCVLILFSLIDAKLIRLQRDEDRNRQGKRKSGQGASKKLFEHIMQEQHIDKKFWLLFSWKNLNSCLLTVFADGDDFKKQPAVINRNFIDHGMFHRKVLKRDCIQIFLLYYNLLEFLEIIYGTK